MTPPHRRLAGLLTATPFTEPADAELLRRFTVDRDEVAFAALVTRHGPMVYGVCRRVLQDRHLAEDAFQAAFLVLVRKAAAVSDPAAVGAWLHGVACWVARAARRNEHLRRRRERTGDEIPDVIAGPTAIPDAGLRDVLDDELRKLPAKYRAVLVACDLEGQPREPVAAALGIPAGTLSSRLTTARKMLAARLTRRGVAPAVAAGVAAAGPAVAGREVPPALLAAAVGFGSDVSGKVPAAVSFLANGVAQTMPVRVLVPASLVLLAAATALALAAESRDPPLPAPRPIGLRGSPPAPAAKEKPRPLPAGPNKLFFTRAVPLVMIDPDGKNEQKLTVSEPPLVDSQGLLVGAHHARAVNPLPNNARVSPDGKQLAMLLGQVEDRGWVVWRLHVRGIDHPGPAIDLGVECQMFAWSADGTEVACSSARPKEGGSGPPEVTHFVVNVTTKATTPLDLPENHLITDWSRDGKHFLTTSVDSSAPHFFAVHRWSRDGREHKSLAGTKRESAMNGQFSPDGSRVLHVRCPRPDDTTALDNSEMRLRVLDLATGKVTPVAGPPARGEIRGFCWSPDGKRIAYTWREVHAGMAEELRNKETASHLVVCDPDGKNAKTIATETGPTPGADTIEDVSWR